MKYLALVVFGLHDFDLVGEFSTWAEASGAANRAATRGGVPRVKTMTSF